MKYDAWDFESLLEEIGRRLRKERLNRNLTQEQLAEAADISVATLRNIEAGKANPTMRVVLQLLRALGLLSRIDGLLPEPGVSPIQLAEMRGSQRERATGRRGEGTHEPEAESETGWEW